MKKVLLLATAFMFVTGVALADKGKKKKCAKGKTCCTKETKTAKAGCCKDKAKSTTASM
jgi:hypothetical protein